jgi:hypothetical protein
MHRHHSWYMHYHGAWDCVRIAPMNVGREIFVFFRPHQRITMLNAKWKPCNKPTNHPPRAAKRPKHAKNASASSAKPPLVQQIACKNLTLSDWLLVYHFVDEHLDASQAEIVEHFGTRQEGPLIFTQSTLSRKLRDRPEMEARTDDNPAALSSKRPRVVTRPDVERALVLWAKDMEQRNEMQGYRGRRWLAGSRRRWISTSYAPRSCVTFGSHFVTLCHTSSSCISIIMH